MMIRVAIVLLLVLQVVGCSSSEERAQSYYQDGVKLLAQHDNKRAAIEFKNAIRLKRDLLPAWRDLAKIEEQDAHWDALVPILQTIVELDPKDIETTLKLGRLFLLAGATDRALNLVNGLDEKADTNAKVLALKAAIYYKLNDKAGAVREAQAALKLDGNNVDALVILAADRLDHGDPKGALQILDSNSIPRTNDLGVQLFKIKIFEQLGDLPQVEALLRRLVELYPREIGFRKQLAQFYIDQHRLSDAEDQLRAIAAAEPTKPEGVLDLVRFLNTTKGPAAARAELVSRISAGGDVFSYQMALAEFDFAQGNFNDSSKLLESLAKSASSPEHAVAAKIELAEMDLQRKNIDAASALVSDVLRSDSRNTDALKLRATVRMDRGQLDLAIADLREALNDQPRSIELMMLLASAYERSGLIDLAAKQFADALRASNFDPNVGLNYAAFLRRRGMLGQADDILTGLASRQPRNPAILSALAEVKLARQDWVGAQEIGEAMQGIAHNKAIADQIVGAALSGQHKYDESIAAFKDAVEAAPAAVQPMVALVRALLSAKETNRAVSFLQAVLQSNPANAEAYVLLGSIQLANNAPDQAKTSFMAAIEKQPKNSIGYRALADFYLRQRNTDTALKIIRVGLQQQPDNIILHMALAGILEQTEDYEGAISEYEYVLAQQPGSMIAANNLASILADHRTDKASLDRAQSLAESLQQSQVPQFKDTLGWIAYRRGDFKAAIPLLEEAIAALPNLALVHYHLGMSYLATGQDAKASGEFKTALAKDPTGELRQTIMAELRKITIE